jgi:plasmid stability protein
MATLTIRNIEDMVKERLRVRAATHGHSMEEEARVILKRAVGGVSGADLWDLSRRLFEGAGGVALEVPGRDADRTAPDFGPPNDFGGAGGR